MVGGRAARRPTDRPLTVLREFPDGDSLPPVMHLLGDDGVYEVRKTLLGVFVARVPVERVVADAFFPDVPKAPAALLARVLDTFRKNPNREALVSITHDRRTGRFDLREGEERETSAVSVTYDPFEEDEHLILYAEIHSHHKMSAYFSRTDDDNEVATGLYGVIGRIDQERPQARFRFSCGGIFCELLARDLFDDAEAVEALVEPPRRFPGLALISLPPAAPRPGEPNRHEGAP